jgi:DNA-binding CsgD family transcriptional regulator
MARMASGMALNVGTQSVPGESGDLLSALFQSSTVGVGIFDRQFRYRAINDALASMNGIPAAAHLGKTIHAVLGKAAAKVQPAFERVFASGEPLSNFEMTAELPSRKAIGRFNANYFPIKDLAGEVQRVGVVVLELTLRNELEAALLRVTDKLCGIRSVLRNHSNAPEDLGSHCASLGDVFARSVELLEGCLSETRLVSQLLQETPRLTAVRPRRAQGRVQAASLYTQELNFASMLPIEEDRDGINPLSSREREIVALLAIGKSNKEIATSLAISTRTVESHRARIMLKLDLHSISDLVRYAVRNQFIQP